MTARDATRVAQAIRYLEDNYRRQPSLDELAGALGTSPFYLQRLFRRWAGVSPKRFLQYLTLEHARAALAEGRSVLATAYDAGLSGPSRLHDLFVTFDAMTPGEFKQGGTGVTIRYGFADTPFGDALVAETSRGICGLAFTQPVSRADAIQDLRNRWPGAQLARDQDRARVLARRIFRGGRRPERLMLDVRGTNFQVKVWEALLRIPTGTLISYSDVAAAVGRPTAQRAVANAVARNPVAYLIPCHRVVRASARLGAYRWGADRKRAMIGWEAARGKAAATR